MKIKKLEKHNGKYELAELPDKINEIIDLLNNSFITQDPDTVYGEVGRPFTVDLSCVDSLTCDRLTPLTNETTCKLTIDHIDNMIEGGGLYDGIKCPKCGAKHFEVGPSVSTCVYYPTIIKDGVNINPDRNKCVTTYTCCECGHKWKE